MQKVRTKRAATRPTDAGVTPGTVLLREELRSGAMRTLDTLKLGERQIVLCAGHDAIWVIVRRKCRGGIAMRAAFVPVGYREARMVQPRAGEAARIEVVSAMGTHRVALCLHEEAIPIVRVATSLEPAVPLLTSFVPRDLYPLDADDDPLGAVGTVEAAQRGFNSGAIYFRLEEPAFGSVLYFQDLTRLNPYFSATDTKPDGAVGGIWPELGYLLPTPPQRGVPPVAPLPAGAETLISDALIAFHDEVDGDERDMARRYLALLGAVLPHLVMPETDYRDWVGRAERSLKDLARSPKATIRHYGHRYVHPYSAAEYPDSMVQLSVLASIRDYEMWTGEKVPIGADLAAGLGKFYDPKLKTLRRYLPNVGRDKDRNAVDSWYLYHPLSMLGRLAIDGDRQAMRLFEKSLDYGIRAAHHFKYKWPIQYDVRDFRVLTEARDDQGLGQTDVGGIYAYVMLQAFELTDDKRYLDEARAAIDAAKGMRFELNYQANLTAWGAAACMRLWRITDDEKYLRQSYVYLASFFHNAAIWESGIGHARHYRNFLGVTALHDAPYMALYECFDSFAAFERYLKDSGPDLDAPVRLLLSQYCRYALDRAWFYYPDALPDDAIAPEQRENNGHVDRKLSFPVEDLYVDGQQAGQVGQEIYGAGAAFVFASRAFHNVRDAPFRMFCDHFVLASQRPSGRALSFQLGGAEGCEASLSLIRIGRAKLPEFTVTTAGGDRIRPRHSAADRVEYRIPADSRITLAW
ncbi:hypothetical protein FHS95_001913 [Sphingomonas naasensis]|uniref:Uncharacterized protein n=1 Tax=Sphingomonas naasensis TaxID=1344951 RepID=A0A4S1WM64_9SPHN|nr:hypothetical protein [Sphingomonas naasensis]NIJ20221.1 hypothetical protein [Sphingomonas naasensis]TGX44364.1 hypothetical protein E5A74_06085 [Sphingomonas naasensis]